MRNIKVAWPQMGGKFTGSCIWCFSKWWLGGGGGGVAVNQGSRLEGVYCSRKDCVATSVPYPHSTYVPYSIVQNPVIYNIVGPQSTHHAVCAHWTQTQLDISVSRTSHYWVTPIESPEQHAVILAGGLCPGLQGSPVWLS